MSSARIADLQPNEERLVSYAVDLGTEVMPEAPADGGRPTHVKAVKGVLYTTTKLRETETYTVKNRNPQGRTVLIEHPVRDQFQLADTTKLAQIARDAYRFELKVPAGQTTKETVTEECNVDSSIPLTDSPDEQVRVFLQSPVVSAKVQEGLKKVMGKVRLPRQAEGANGPGAAPRAALPSRPGPGAPALRVRSGQGAAGAAVGQSPRPPPHKPSSPPDKARGRAWRIWWTSVDLW
jgi:hypothetical protein